MKKMFALLLAVILGSCEVATAHDWYAPLQRPDMAGSCCNSEAEAHNGDCAPTLARSNPSGTTKWQALFRGKWIDVPNAKILKDVESPDGKAHLCARPYLDVNVYVYCFIEPAPEG